MEESIENKTLYTKLAHELTNSRQGPRMSASEIVTLAAYIQQEGGPSSRQSTRRAPSENVGLKVPDLNTPRRSSFRNQRRQALNPFDPNFQKLLQSERSMLSSGGSNGSRVSRRDSFEGLILPEGHRPEHLSRFHFMVPTQGSDEEEASMKSDDESMNRSEREQKQMEDLLRHKIVINSIKSTNSHEELQQILTGLQDASKKVKTIAKESGNSIKLTEKEMKTDLETLKGSILKAYSQAQNKMSKKMQEYQHVKKGEPEKNVGKADQATEVSPNSTIYY